MENTLTSSVHSEADLLNGKCPPSVYYNMKIILSRKSSHDGIGALFLLIGRTNFVVVRLIDIEYVEGNLRMTIIDQESGDLHTISHSIYDETPKFTLVKLSDILELSEIAALRDEL